MSPSLTVRDINPADKSWLKHQARHVGVSMEEFVRRLIHEERAKAERRPMPSEAFARHFGKQHGVEMPDPVHTSYRPISFSTEQGQ